MTTWYKFRDVSTIYKYRNEDQMRITWDNFREPDVQFEKYEDLEKNRNQFKNHQ